MALTEVRVIGKWLLANGQPASGYVNFQLRSDLANANNAIVADTPISAVLDSTGSVDITLFATDDNASSPIGATYTVTEEIDGSPNRSYDIEISKTATIIDLSSVAPVAPDLGTVAYALQSALLAEQTARISSDALLQPLSEKDQPEGYPGLNIDSQIAESVVPPLPESLIIDLGTDLANKASVDDLVAETNRATLAESNEVTNRQNADNARQLLSQKGAPNGYMGLDSSGRGSQPPKLHASDHATGSPDAISPSSIGAETPTGAQAKADAAIVTSEAFTTAGLTTRIPYLPGIVADRVTDNAAIINALPDDGGRYRLPPGGVLCKSPVATRRGVMIEGQGNSVPSNITDPSKSGLIFDDTTIISAKLAASIFADGSTWTYTVPVGHGLVAGNKILGSGFSNSLWNVMQTIVSVTATTIVTTNTTVPVVGGASGAGFIKYGHNATVISDGTIWTFTVPAGHGLQAGNSFTASGFTNTGFNVFCTIASVTATTLVVNNNSILVPTGVGDSGFVNVHLFRAGPMDNFGPSSGARDLWIECNDIPGSIACFSRSIQEMGGFERLNIHHPVYRGILVDSRSLNGDDWAALNYTIRDIRCIGSVMGDTTYVGLETQGSNITVRGFDGIMCGGGNTINKPVAQIILNGCRSGIFSRLHTETSTNGVLIGPEKECIGIAIDNVTGNIRCDNTVRIASPTSGSPNQQITLRSIFPNNSPTSSLTDDQNSVSYTGTVGMFATDLNGGIKANTSVFDGVITATMSLTPAPDHSILTASDSDLINITLPVGRWIVMAGATIVPGASTTSVDMRIVANGATAAISGQRSCSFTISGTQPANGSFAAVVDVRVAGNFVLRFRGTGGTATAKATSVTQGYANATALTAVKAP
jgi:hypothetical protein